MQLPPQPIATWSPTKVCLIALARAPRAQEPRIPPTSTQSHRHGDLRCAESVNDVIRTCPCFCWRLVRSAWRRGSDGLLCALASERAAHSDMRCQEAQQHAHGPECPELGGASHRPFPLKPGVAEGRFCRPPSTAPAARRARETHIVCWSTLRTRQECRVARLKWRTPNGLGTAANRSHQFQTRGARSRSHSWHQTTPPAWQCTAIVRCGRRGPDGSLMALTRAWRKQPRRRARNHSCAPAVQQAMFTLKCE